MAERVAIVGSRDWPDPERVRAYVRSLPPGTVVVSGGAYGPDMWAENEARDRDLAVRVHHADWNRHGRAAGPMRNSRIVADCDRVVAFTTGSRGTADTVRKARAAGKPVEVIALDVSPRCPGCRSRADSVCPKCRP